MGQRPDTGQSAAEEAGGNWHENVRIDDVRSENSNMVENPIATITPVNQVFCGYCGAIFMEPLGGTTLNNHIKTVHFNHNPEIQSNSSILPGTPGSFGLPGFLGPNIPPDTLPSTPNIFQYPRPVLRRGHRRATSTFIPSRPEMVEDGRSENSQNPNPIMQQSHGPDMGQRLDMVQPAIRGIPCYRSSRHCAAQKQGLPIEVPHSIISNNNLQNVQTPDGRNVETPLNQLQPIDNLQNVQNVQTLVAANTANLEPILLDGHPGAQKVNF